MRGKSALLAVILILAIILAAVGGSFLILSNNYLVDFKLYPKNATSMDLRLQVPFLEDYHSARERDYDRTPAHQRHHGNHRGHPV